MIIGVPKEIKRDEYRVALLPVGAEELVHAGHTVLVEAGAGLGSGIPDQDYLQQGAQVVAGPEEIFARADLVIKVKEPQPAEWPLIRPGQVLFTYFHFAASRELTEAMLASGASCVAYETLRDERGRLPLLTPMSEVAGRMSIQEVRQVPGAAAVGPRHPAGRSSRRGPRAHFDSGRGSGRRECRQDRGRVSRRCRHPGREHGPAALPGRHHAAQCQLLVQRPPHDPAATAAGGPGHRCGPDSRRESPASWCGERT